VIALLSAAMVGGAFLAFDILGADGNSRWGSALWLLCVAFVGFVLYLPAMAFDSEKTPSWQTFRDNLRTLPQVIVASIVKFIGLIIKFSGRMLLLGAIVILGNLCLLLMSEWYPFLVVALSVAFVAAWRWLPLQLHCIARPSSQRL
jgi:hypothetical protein